MIARTLTIARKELWHILRNPRTLAIIFLVPIVQLFLLGYAATTDVEHLTTVVLDRDQTTQSREVIRAYANSNYFDIVAYVDTDEELAGMVDWGKARAGLIIPAGYGENIAAGKQATIACIIDGSDPNVATTVFAASQQVGQAQSMQIIERRLGISPEEMIALEVRPRVWYNPEMKSVNFMIPGLMGVVLFMVTTMLTALAIVREREQGTIEQLLVTPIRPIELIVGKVIPYIGVAFFNVLEVLAIGTLWFRVPIHGSVALLLALTTIFLMSALGLGIFISSAAATQQEAMMLIWFIMLPSLFLAGFFFPLEAMPAALQALSYVIPLRYMLEIIRGIILKGVGLDVLLREVIALLVFGVGIVVIAATRFRRQIE